MPSVTDVPLQFALGDAFTQGFGWTSGLSQLYYTLADTLRLPARTALVLEPER